MEISKIIVLLLVFSPCVFMVSHGLFIVILNEDIQYFLKADEERIQNLKNELQNSNVCWADKESIDIVFQDYFHLK